MLDDVHLVDAYDGQKNAEEIRHSAQKKQLKVPASVPSLEFCASDPSQMAIMGDLSRCDWALW
jgi:hypothetical protein